MTDDNLCYLSATALAREIQQRTISAVEAVTAHLQRLEYLNPTLNTVVQIAPESALAQARAADEALSQGRSLGPLHGVPFTVKDVFEVGNETRLVTMPGMADPIHPVATRDSTAVRRLRMVGAIPIAVTRATLWSDRDEHYGIVPNPYDAHHTVSGSSGGEAATIAAGGSPLGLGSDSGGSLRMPAHFCGVATVRPSNGRVPRATDAAGTNDPRTVAGPLARKIEDVALALSIITGFDWDEPTTLPMPLYDFHAVRLQGMRAAVFTNNGLVEPTLEISEAVYAAADALSLAGITLTQVTPPGMEEAWQITLDYWRYCGETGTVAEYFRFLERWDRYRLLANSFIQDYDLIVCPVEAFPAPSLDAQGTPPAFTYTTPFSLVGWPCGVVRAGTSPAHLPIGVQVVGQPWRDDLVLSACQQIETVCGGWQLPPAFP